jgi:hypothetical protein
LNTNEFTIFDLGRRGSTALSKKPTKRKRMKKGTKVSWQVKGALGRGNGVVISDEEDGGVLVAVNSMTGEPNPGYHRVIHCTVTWLTVEEPAAKAAAPKPQRTPLKGTNGTKGTDAADVPTTDSGSAPIGEGAAETTQP